MSLISGEAILGHSDRLNAMTSSLNGDRGHRQRQRQEFPSHKLLRARPGDPGLLPAPLTLGQKHEDVHGQLGTVSQTKEGKEAS